MLATLEPGELHRFDGKPHPYCCKPGCAMEHLHFVKTIMTREFKKTKRREKATLKFDRHKCVACGLVHDIGSWSV